MVIVEDHTALREVLRAYLETNGFQVVGESARGEGSVDVVVDLRPGAVGLDWHLGGPGLDGAATLARLRDQAPDVPVVVFTNDVSVTESAVDLGAVAVIDKGSPPARLMAALNGTSATR